MMRSILTELVPKAQVGEVSRLMALAVHAGYNDFYLREADENVIQSMFGCDELFTSGVMAKILSKLRANELPPPAEPASPEDYQVAINHFRDQESRNGGKILHGAQSDYINDLFFTKNINMQHAVLSRKLRGQQTGNHKGRAQLLSDEICREVITPALKLFRSKGQTKWTPMVKLLMRQLLRIQEGVEAPTGILELIQRNHAHFANISDIIDSDDDSNDSDSSSDTTEGDGDEGRGEQEILNEEEQEELMTVDLQTGQLLDHIAASKSSGKRLQFHDFPNNRTFKRYKKKYKWAERKLEVLAAHRQSGSNRDQSIQQALQGFGMATVQVPDDIRVQDLVDSSAFDVFVQASFLDRSLEEHRQLKTILGAWEQTKKEVSAAAKRNRSRALIAQVNSFNQEGLQQESEQAEAQKVQRDFDLLQSSIEKCQKKSDECFNQYKIAASRGERIDKLLNGANPPPFSQQNKRCIEMLLSNVSNGDELWNVAVQEESKIRGMEIQGNERAESMRSEFSTTWAGIQDRKYSIDVDCGIMHATNLACSWEDHHAEMEALFASK